MPHTHQACATVDRRRVGTARCEPARWPTSRAHPRTARSAAPGDTPAHLRVLLLHLLHQPALRDEALPLLLAALRLDLRRQRVAVLRRCEARVGRLRHRAPLTAAARRAAVRRRHLDHRLQQLVLLLLLLLLLVRLVRRWQRSRRLQPRPGGARPASATQRSMLPDADAAWRAGVCAVLPAAALKQGGGAAGLHSCVCEVAHAWATSAAACDTYGAARSTGAVRRAPRCCLQLVFAHVLQGFGCAHALPPHMRGAGRP
jgi:hypothetical protein